MTWAVSKRKPVSERMFVYKKMGLRSWGEDGWKIYKDLTSYKRNLYTCSAAMHSGLHPHSVNIHSAPWEQKQQTKTECIKPFHRPGKNPTEHQLLNANKTILSTRTTSSTINFEFFHLFHSISTRSCLSCCLFSKLNELGLSTDITHETIWP